MKNLNKKMIILSFALTAILLFGGWFAYQYYGAEKPVEDKIAEYEGVELVEYIPGQKSVHLILEFENRPLFGQDLLQLRQFIEKSQKGKAVHLSVADDQGVNHPWWLQHSAAITEAVHQQQYSKIDPIIQQWKADGLISEGNVMMNQEHLFIYLEPMKDSEVYIYIPLSVDR